jgi:hypothetical protein
MRVNMTRLLDRGIKRPTRAMPITGDLLLEIDGDARRLLVLHSIEKSEIPVMGRLLHPQLSEMGARSFVAHGYEIDKITGQLFGQAWELEPVRR